MSRFQRLPIRQKLVGMIMATAMGILIVASTGYLVTDYVRARNDMVRDLSAQASMIIENSEAALRFDVPSDAEQTLRSLQFNPQVRAGCLFKADGRLFAQYINNARTPCPESPGPPSHAFDASRLHLTVAPLLNGKVIGSLYVRSDLALVHRRLQQQAIMTAVLALVALGVGLIVSSRLQRIVSDPLTGLARTAADVSAHGDYSIRAARTTDDELGVLVDSFNRMLDRIQSRESDLSRANADLRREIVERQRAEQERAAMLVREREANRLKDEFLATLSHELRTPLNAILGWTKLLRTSAVPAAQVDRALEKVQRNAEVQARLVEDLLEVSRIASGKLRLDVRDVDLVALANSAVDSIRLAAEARGIAIDREFAASTLPTAGDPDRLQQVLWNLLSNAVKFTPPGGRVTVRIRRDGAEDELIVQDTGTGIDPEFLPHVFDTFRQADASTTRAFGGLGLGLSIVRQLVEVHGGRVRAESAGLQQGATFTVRLPVRWIAPAQPAIEADVSAAVRARLAGKTVVVVDDDEDTRELLNSLLFAAGARPIVAASADEGLSACIEHRPDVLISDIAMPGQDGYAMIRQVRMALGASAPRVNVALTAFAGERDRLLSAEAGFQAHLAKPFDPNALVQLVSDLLDGRKPAAFGV